MELPLVLHLDPASFPDRLAGNRVTLRWWVHNISPRELADVRVTLLATHSDPGISFPANAESGAFLLAGKGTYVHSQLVIHESGSYPVRVRLDAALPDGRLLRCVSTNEIGLPTFVLQKDAGRISLNANDHSNLGARKLPAWMLGQVDINLGGRSVAMLDGLIEDAGNLAQKGLASGFVRPDISTLLEVELRALQLDGLRTLDFEQIVATWPQRRRLRVSVVDEQQKVVSEAIADGKTKYFVRLGMPDDGYITILLKDDSGACCLLAPCTMHAESQSALLRRGTMARFPRDETDPERVHGLVYDQPERTEVLALCSREPLLSKAEPVARAGYPSLEKADAIALIRRASEMEGTDIGWAKLTVK